MKQQIKQEQIEQVVQIALEDLCPGEGNRKIGGFDQKKLEQLAESIKAVGVQQPAVVRLTYEESPATSALNECEAKKNGTTPPPKVKKYEIVAGERRWRAAKLAGLTTLPCVVRNLDDLTMLKVRTIENLQREDVHPLDEAAGYAGLIEKAGYDAEHVAQEVGKSVSYVYQRLKLLELIAPAREMLINGKISAGHAILLARLLPEQQKETLKSHLFRNGDPSVRDVDNFIREHIFMELSKAAFSKDDADLVAAAGPCTTCQKRTGFAPTLFADVCKKDNCLDKNCFKDKLDSLVKRNMAELGNESHLLVSEEHYYIDPLHAKDIPKGTLGKNKWTECKAKDEGAVRCLVVDGLGRGRLTWGKKDWLQSYKTERTPQEKAADEKRKRELQIKRDARRRIWDEVFEALPSAAAQELPLEILRIIVAQAWDRLWHDSKTTFAKVEGWEKPKKKANDYSNGREAQGMVIIAKLDRIGLITFLTKITLIQTLDVQPQYGPHYAEKPLHEAAKVLGLDPKAIEARVRKEAAGQSETKGKPKAKNKAKAEKT